MTHIRGRGERAVAVETRGGQHRDGGGGGGTRGGTGGGCRGTGLPGDGVTGERGPRRRP